MIRELDIKWVDSANFVPLNRELLEMMRDAGAVRFMYGLESGSPKILRYVGKNFTIPIAEKRLKETWEVGIWSELSLICGFPHERESDVRMTIEFLSRNRKYIKSAYLNKFFLDGVIKRFPSKYGISIRSDSYESGETLREAWRGGFDEINGLKWEDRKKLTDWSYEQITSAMDKFGIRPGTVIQEILYLGSLPEWDDILKGNIDF